MLPFNPDLIRPDTFPKYEPEQTFDNEGNLMLGDLPLKKFDVKPLDVDAYIKEFEVQPILKLKVVHMYMCRCTLYNVLYFSFYAYKLHCTIPTYMYQCCSPMVLFAFCHLLRNAFHVAMPKKECLKRVLKKNS